MIEWKTRINGAQEEAIESVGCACVGSCPWSVHQQPHDPQPWLLGHFESRAAACEGWAALRELVPGLPEQPEQERELEDREWQEAYKAFLQPWSAGDLHWVPVWRRDTYLVPEGAACVYFDAGMAFGTGSHETTRLCAQRLLDLRAARRGAVAGLSVVDAGCGSGILAISARLLGFGSVYGFDRDAEAVRVSRENLLFNGLSAESVLFVEAGIEEGLRGRQADLLLANIQADVLGVYVEELLEAVAPGGVLAMSGILARELDGVRQRFLDACGRIGPVDTEARVMGEWADLALFRR